MQQYRFQKDPPCWWSPRRPFQRSYLLVGIGDALNQLIRVVAKLSRASIKDGRHGGGLVLDRSNAHSQTNGCPFYKLDWWCCLAFDLTPFLLANRPIGQREVFTVPNEQDVCIEE